MESRNWTVEQTDTMTRITVPAERPDETTETPPASSTTTATGLTAATRMERLSTLRDRARELAARKERTGRLQIAPVAGKHVCDYVTPYHIKVGPDKVIVGRACSCGGRQAADLLPADRARVLYARLKGART